METWKIQVQRESKDSPGLRDGERLLVFLGPSKKKAGNIPHTSAAEVPAAKSDNPLMRVLAKASPLLRGLGGLLTHPHQ